MSSTPAPIAIIEPNGPWEAADFIVAAVFYLVQGACLLALVEMIIWVTKRKR